MLHSHIAVDSRVTLQCSTFHTDHMIDQELKSFLFSPKQNSIYFGYLLSWAATRAINMERTFLTIILWLNNKYELSSLQYSIKLFIHISILREKYVFLSHLKYTHRSSNNLRVFWNSKYIFFISFFSHKQLSAFYIGWTLRHRETRCTRLGSSIIITTPASTYASWTSNSCAF